MESKICTTATPVGVADVTQKIEGNYFWTMLCLFAFLSQFQPSEPFLVDFLVGDKGLPNREVYTSIFDLFVYARLPFIALIGFLSELPFATSRGMLVVGAMCSVTTVLLTRFGNGLESQQAAQFTVAFAFASRMAIPALIFSRTPAAQCQERVFALKAIMLLSNCCSAALGELLRDETGMPLASLFDISTIAQVLALVCVMLIPASPNGSGEAAPQATEGPEVADPEDAQSAKLNWGCSTEILCRLQQLQEPLCDLWSSVRLRSVMWWTTWALAMNPVHGLMMMYWQSLVRAKNFTSDHNGSMMAVMYFVASILIFVSGRSKPLFSCPSVVVIGSTLVSGLLICRIVAESQQGPLFAWLLAYLCIFEVATAVGTFQVGYEVTRAAEVSSANGTFGQTPRCARLTLLFSTTVTLAGVTEVGMQVVFQSLRSVVFRIEGLGISLTVLALVLMLARGFEATMKPKVLNEMPLLIHESAGTAEHV